jgi:hypothetical protein
MKSARLRPIYLALVLAICSVARPQNIPNSPAPAPLPDPAWTNLQNVTIGSPVIVTDVDGRSVHCLFAGVTDAFLFCNPQGNPAGVGFRFDHAEVIGVDFDRPSQQIALTAPREHNYHPAWISSMIAGGLIVGLCATRNTDAATSARAGLIAAGVVGAIGAPLAFLPHPQMAPPVPAYPPYVFGARLRFPAYSRIRR